MLPVEVRKIFIARFFLTAILTGTLLFGSIAYFFYLDRLHIVEKIKDHERVYLDVYQNIINVQFQQIEADLRWLAEQNELQSWLLTHSSNDHQAMAKEYRLLSQSRRTYDQIRFLDASGDEIVRANFNSGAPYVVAASHLQNKQLRYYFKDTWSLDKDKIFVSPLDLNMEHGQIEFPLKPMLRFGIPVFDSTGQKRGVIIINYLAGDLLQALEKASLRTDGDLMLLNPESFWLLSPVASDEWGFMLSDRKGKQFSKSYPQEWKAIYSALDGQLHNPQGLFSFSTIYPFNIDTQSSSGQEPNSNSGERISGSNYFWKIVSHVPTELMDAQPEALRYSRIGVGLLAAVFVSILSTLVALSSVRRKIYQSNLKKLALRDVLTGIANRKAFQDRLEQAFQHAYRYQEQIGVMIIDLDNFKPINDTYGHDIGDAVLKEVATRLQACLRLPDIVARLGGDEFAIIMSQADLGAGMDIVAARILEKFSHPISLNNRNLVVSVSIGASHFPATAKNPTELLKQADIAMYDAKRKGKNGYCLYASPIPGQDLDVLKVS
jgi:diguanylate cyclase (GGDEF)-like protein